MTNNGILKVGDSFSELVISGDYSQTGNLFMKVAGQQPGVSQDIIRVKGSLQLGGPLTLSFAGMQTMPAGTSITIIDNQGSNLVFGTFADLPQGATITNAGSVFVIDYMGGDGNDVVLWTGWPDLTVTSFLFDPLHGGLAFSYANQGSHLPLQTTVGLFWANGPTTNDIITNVSPIFTTNIPVGFTGQATDYIPESLLNYPPTNATHFLLSLDPGNLVNESTKTNNVAVLTNTFRHVVLVMMENRSFDHLLGWLPNAEGKQSGLTYFDTNRQSHFTWPLAPNYQGCGCGDPDHSFGGGRLEYDTNLLTFGQCDGWLQANDIFSVGYYVQTDLPFLGQVATNWTVCDHYFAAIMAETQPNRIYQHSAQTDSLTNRLGLAGFGQHPLNLPTIWDRLAQTNVSGRYYTEGLPFLYLYGPGTYASIMFNVRAFYQDCASGSLPSVSFVDPTLTFDDAKPGDDDHPFGDIRSGEQFLASIYNAIVSSPNWSSTVLIINFDEWGGFFDHVAPPIAQVPQQEDGAYAAVNILPTDATYGLRGFRVPCLIISPWARRSFVAKDVFDHTSVLKLIENRFNVKPLTERDQFASNLADVLNLANPDFTHPPQISVPSGPFGTSCDEIQETRDSNGDIIVSWDATCRKVTVQTAPTTAGPWTDLTVVSVSPYVLTEAEQQKSAEGYFRFVLK
jgi:phospholipase C